MKNSFVKRLVPPGFTDARSIGFLLLLLSLPPACLSQQIKKKTELVFAKDRLTFEVAESKSNSGRGNGTGLNILRGIAAAGGNPVPMPEDHSSDPDWDPNTDASVGLSLRVGMRCYSHIGDKAVVLRVDGIRVLVEVRRPRYFYIGPQSGPALVPTVESGLLDFREIDNTPACLNNIKLWIDRDVFVALQVSPVANGQAAADNSAAPRDGGLQ